MTVTHDFNRTLKHFWVRFLPKPLRPSPLLATLDSPNRLGEMYLDMIHIVTDQVTLDDCQDITDKKMNFATNGKGRLFQRQGIEFKVFHLPGQEKVEINPRQFPSYEELQHFIIGIININNHHLTRVDVTIFFKKKYFNVDVLSMITEFQGRNCSSTYPNKKGGMYRKGGILRETLVVGKDPIRLSIYDKDSKNDTRSQGHVPPMRGHTVFELQLKHNYLKKRKICQTCDLRLLNILDPFEDIHFHNVYALLEQGQINKIPLYVSFFISCAAVGFHSAKLLLGRETNGKFEEIFDHLRPFTIGTRQISLKTAVDKIYQRDLNAWLTGPLRRPRFYRDKKPQVYALFPSSSDIR